MSVTDACKRAATKMLHAAENVQRAFACSREIGTGRIVASCQQAACRVMMLSCLPLDDMKPGLRLDDLGHFTWLQRKRRLLELGLHVTLSEESPSNAVSKLCFIRDDDAVCV